MKTKFKTKLLQFGNNTGIEVPVSNLKELGDSKKPPVNVDVNGYVYKSTVASMGGKYLISFSKAHREKSGIMGGDEITVELALDKGPREVEIPKLLQDALHNKQLLDNFEGLSYSKRKEYARQINDAKTEDTKLRRLNKIIDDLC